MDGRRASSYLRMAASDPAKVAQRKLMIECFLNDVASPLPPLPPKPDGGVRLLSWNLNILCGPDWDTPVSAADVAKVISELDADILAMQEMPCESLDQKWDARLAAPLARVRQLDEMLAGMGYSTLARSPADNPTLLASRLPLRNVEPFTLDVDGPTASLNHYEGREEVWLESRAALYAEVDVGSRGTTGLGVYATHLSHKDATLIKKHANEQQPQQQAATPTDQAERAEAGGNMRAAPKEWADAVKMDGVRRRQAEALMKHWRARRGTAGGSAAGQAAVVLADFNQPLQAHYTLEEWGVVSAGLSSPAVAQPLDDGVASLLRAEGFGDAFELCGNAHNFGPCRSSPPLTHWTGTTVDFAYVHDGGLPSPPASSPPPPVGDDASMSQRSDGAWRVAGAYVRNSALSDHLPVVVDLVYMAEAGSKGRAVSGSRDEIEK
jgi:endonuclease/exonuclease/phosphatase family metal-dependent hydrolase